MTNFMYSRNYLLFLYNQGTKLERMIPQVLIENFSKRKKKLFFFCAALSNFQFNDVII